MKCREVVMNLMFHGGLCEVLSRLFLRTVLVL
jgi:hypothetical protein